MFLEGLRTSAATRDAVDVDDCLAIERSFAWVGRRVLVSVLAGASAMCLQFDGTVQRVVAGCVLGLVYLVAMQVGAATGTKRKMRDLYGDAHRTSAST